jgi:uncharacterized protein YxjI
MIQLIFLLSFSITGCHSFMGTPLRRDVSLPSKAQFKMNLLSDIGDMLGAGGNNLEPQKVLPYSPAFCSSLSCQEGIRTFAVQERLLTFTGEDFDIADATDGSPFVRVRGAMMHLPGKDKLRVYSATSGDELLVLDRKLIAATPTYDIYRAGMGAEKIGWIEKKLISMTDTFDVYMEGKGGFGVTGE